MDSIGCVPCVDSKKSLCTPEQLINKMSDKGVTFNSVTKSAAVQYLEKNNNYYKLSSYRKNYNKKTDGKYVGLDFSHLIDLAIIDMQLRHIIMRMALDIEHFEKVILLNFLVRKGDDGYETLKEYKESLSNEDSTPLGKNASPARDKFEKEIERNEKSIYCRDMLKHVQPGQDMPVWVFVEVVSFGRFRGFLEFCAKKYNDKTLLDDAYRLKSVKSIRNAAGHNNCILNDLTLKSGTMDMNRKVLNKFKAVYQTTDYVGYNKEPRAIQNDRIKEIITLFYVHSRILPSQKMREHYKDDLCNFITRMNRHRDDYYANNTNIISAFTIIEKIVDAWY